MFGLLCKLRGLHTSRVTPAWGPFGASSIDAPSVYPCRWCGTIPPRDLNLLREHFADKRDKWVWWESHTRDS